MIDRSDLSDLLQRTQRLAAKLRDLATYADVSTSKFIAAQVADLEEDMARVIENEMDRRIRVQQFTRRSAPTTGAGVQLVRSQQSEPPALSGTWGGRRRAG